MGSLPTAPIMRMGNGVTTQQAYHHQCHFIQEADVASGMRSISQRPLLKCLHSCTTQFTSAWTFLTSNATCAQVLTFLVPKSGNAPTTTQIFSRARWTHLHLELMIMQLVYQQPQMLCQHSQETHHALLTPSRAQEGHQGGGQGCSCCGCNHCCAFAKVLQVLISELCWRNLALMG